MYNSLKIDSKKAKRLSIIFLILSFIFALGLVKKSFQNDTFYTIKIGELIINHGIDMLDHFSFHNALAYTYPHWLYDSFIYLVYKIGGYTSIYISTILLFYILITIVYKTNLTLCKNIFAATFATFICELAIASFITARAQLVSFILFVLVIYFIEMFLKKKKKKYLFGLLLVSLILCNIHVAVWPFYFILYLPYFAEYLTAIILNKIKKDNKITKFIKNKFIIEKNDGIKVLFIIFILSILTGLLTPIGDTPYTYIIKTMQGNSTSYINEHQMLSWAESPFTIIIAIETLFLVAISKTKIRDFFMISGLILMSIISIRHLSFLALIGTICFARVFTLFLNNYNIPMEEKFINIVSNKKLLIPLIVIIVSLSTYLFTNQLKKDYIDKTLYPVDATTYIKKNIDTTNMRLFNDYNFGSYLLLNDIKVFIDSRADLYTKPFSSYKYDIFDDYTYVVNQYNQTFDFYNITHILIYKENNNLYNVLSKDNNYKSLYEDKYFILYERLNKPDIYLSYKN